MFVCCLNVFGAALDVTSDGVGSRADQTEVSGDLRLSVVRFCYFVCR
jgi:hypothetical protein